MKTSFNELVVLEPVFSLKIATSTFFFGALIASPTHQQSPPRNETPFTVFHQTLFERLPVVIVFWFGFGLR